MAIEIDISHVARLARLALSEEDLEGYRSQLADILSHAARVQSLEDDPHPDSAHPLGLVNAFRDDVIAPSLHRDEVLSQAPQAIEGYFGAPPALDVE